MALAGASLMAKFDKDEYRKRREAGESGIEKETDVAGYTPPFLVPQGEYGSRKQRRKFEAHGQGRKRRESK
jgi:hypothetical protein